MAQELDREEQGSLRAFAEARCGLSLSPLMAAVMDAAEGIPVTTVDDAASERHFGCARASLPPRRVRTVVVRAGGRAGKSTRLLAPAALCAALTVPVPSLAPGESAYAILVAPSLRLARQTLSFVRGYVEQSEALKSALDGEPTVDGLSLRRPDGTTVRVEVFAAGRGGAQLRAKTLVFAGFDEACFFHDEATGVVNDAELYRAVAPRVVPGGQIWLASTPWLAGVGLIEEYIGRDWGTHTHALCVVAGTRALNPSWDPDGSIERDLRAQDPDAADREIEAKPLAGGSSLWFSADAITQAVTPHVAHEPHADWAYFAGGDAGFRRNSSALAIVGTKSSIYRTVLLDEVQPQPGLPLQPSAVIDRFAPEMQRYRCGHLVVDSHERDEVHTELTRHGCSARPAPLPEEAFIEARRLLHEGKIQLLQHPRLLQQLRAVVGKPRPGGGTTIVLPRRADGSHGDLVSAWVNAVWAAVHPVPTAPSPRPKLIGTPRVAGI